MSGRNEMNDADLGALRTTISRFKNRERVYMNKIPKNMLRIKPSPFVGRTSIPNLPRNTRTTDKNIIIEITPKTAREDKRFSKKNRDGDSLVYFVTYRIDFDEYIRDIVIPEAADESDITSRAPKAVPK